MSGIIIAIVFVAIVIVVVLVGVGAYNGFVKSRNQIQESWRQIDVELNRRYDLIPNLVNTVQGYASHERNTLDAVTRLRAQAQQLAQSGGDVPTQQRADVEQALSGALGSLVVSVEAYPELKSNQNFLELQRQLAESEDRIANGRRYYNANVRAYNTKVESVPTNLIAGIFKFEKAGYFEVSDAAVRQAPTVNFGGLTAPSDPPQGQIGAPPAYGQPSDSLPNSQQYQEQPQYQQPPAQYQNPPGGYTPPQT